MRSLLYYTLLIFIIFLMSLIPNTTFAQDDTRDIPVIETEDDSDFTPLDLSCFSDSDPNKKVLFIFDLIKKIKKKQILTLNMDIPSKDNNPSTERRLKLKVSLDGGGVSTDLRFEIKK